MTATLTSKHPRQLIQTLSSLYGKDWASWEPEILMLKMEREMNMSFEGKEGALEAERLMAIRHLLTADEPYPGPAAFENVAHALSGTHFVFGVLEPCSVGELVYARWATERIVDKVPPLKWGVRAYGAACLVEEGAHLAPKELLLEPFNEPLDLVSSASEKSRLTASMLFQKAWKVRDQGAIAMVRRLGKEIDKMRTAPGERMENLDSEDALASQTAVRLVEACAFIEKRGVDLSNL